MEIAIRPLDDPDVAALTAAVQAEYVELYGGPDSDEIVPAHFAPPHGLFLLGLVDGAPVATGGWRLLDGEPEPTAEIKRMYVAPVGRRRGVARAMLAELERTAAAAGVRRMVLMTGSRQPAAIALYEADGYAAVPRYGHYAQQSGARAFAKRLD